MPTVRRGHFIGEQWLSGRVLDSRPRGCGFKPHRRHCIESLSKALYPLLSTDSTQVEISQHDCKESKQTKEGVQKLLTQNLHCGCSKETSQCEGSLSTQNIC